MSQVIRPREREAILQSLRAGVVPRIGLQHIQVGRQAEVAAILDDLQLIRDDAATVRFIIGRFGSGKSFFLNLARTVALEQRFVVAQADLTPDRRLHATGGAARALYAELMHNASIRAKPEGGALASVVERWVAEVDHTVRQDGGTDTQVARSIRERLQPLQELVSGYDFSHVLVRYFEGFQADDQALMSAALRWLRAEYSTKTEARADLGVRSIIDDADVYDYLKLFARFVRIAGYAGFLVSLDEMGVLSHRLNNSLARNANYEMILRILNDCLQGSVGGIGFLFAGTDTFLQDQRRGLFSYEALATRLADNGLVPNGWRDLSGPVVRLPNLGIEELYVLFGNIRHVFATGDPAKYLVDEAGIQAYMSHCASKLGAEFFLSPREAVRGFVTYLSLLEQNPGTDWRSMLGDTALTPRANLEAEDADAVPAVSAGTVDSTEDDLSNFSL